jgi:CheY-like chemotaxis protein
MNAELVTSQTPTPKKVLIVDDSYDMRQLIRRWVEDAGYQVMVADGAQTGLQICKESTVDIAVCDVRMPGRDGVWLADQLRTQSPHTVVVFATAVEDLNPFVTLGPGVAAYVVKPLRRTEVIAALTRAVAMVGTAPTQRAPLNLSDLDAWDCQ